LSFYSLLDICSGGAHLLVLLREFTEEWGFATMAWDDKDLQSNLDALAYKRLIDDLGGGKYQIGDLVIRWKD
jgi:hypothetical protein